MLVTNRINRNCIKTHSTLKGALTVLVVILGCHSLIAQMLDNSNGLAFTERPFFNRTFIKEHKIKLLNGKYTYKKSGEIIQNTTYRMVYQFDQEGQLIFAFETKQDDGTRDTMWNRYTYNSKHQLIEHKRGDHKGFRTIAYEYDHKNRIIKESHFDEKPDSSGKLIKEPITFETMHYEDMGNQTKKTINNSYGLPFIYEFYTYNDSNQVIRKDIQYVMSSQTEHWKYTYTNQGKLAQCMKYEGSDENVLEETRFTYDERGNLYDKQTYKKGKFENEIEFLFNDKTQCLTYILNRDVASNLILILTFKDYYYFP
jgi:hypothetical protein